MSKLSERNLKFETKQLHIGQETADPVTDARAVPIYATTSYVFHNSQHAADRFALKDAGNIYGRLTNPTEDVFEKRIAALEGGTAALAVASGAAAVSYALQALAKAGDNIVAAKTIYGGTYNLFNVTMRKLGIDFTFVSPDATEEEIQAAFKPNTKAVFGETISNPSLDILDIERFAKVAHKNGVPLIVDNTFATPINCRVFDWGVDIVTHSTTKYMEGHASTIGGVIVDSGNFDWNASGKFPTLTEPDPGYHGISFAEAAGAAAFVTRIRAVLLRDTGAALSPFNAFLLLQGLETLSLRVERHTLNAVKAVNYLKDHPKVNRVNHPSISDNGDPELYKKYFPNGGGSIFTFEIKGGEAEAKRFIDSLELFSLLANVADAKSLVIHPASTTHSQLSEKELLKQNIKPNTIRLSIGIEHIDDIINDLSQAFDKI